MTSRIPLVIGSDGLPQQLQSGDSLAGIDTSLFARKFAVNVGDGSTTAITVTHNLGSLDVQVQLVEISTGATVDADVTRPTTNTVLLTFVVAPTTSQYRCLVQG